MNISYLRYFIAIAESNSLAKAANSLFISQQGLSKAVMSLESRYGVKLLVRSRKGVVLTDEGRKLLGYAEKVIEDYDELELAMMGRNRSAEILQGAGVKISTSMICLLTIVSELRGRGFLSEVVIKESETDRILGEEDSPWLALVDLPSYKYDPNNIGPDKKAVPLFESRLGIVFNRKAFPGIGDKVSVRNIRTMPLGIAGTETMHDVCDHLFVEGQPTDVRQLSTDAQAHIQSAFNGNLAVLTLSHHWEQIAKHDPKGATLGFASIDTDIFLTIAFVCSKKALESEVNRLFVEHVARELELIRRERNR